MKKLLLAAPLGLALALAAGLATANSGTIQFAGMINAGTCPVEIIDPISGGVGNIVPLGVAIVAEFPQAGAEAKTRAFGMRITPGNGCTLDPGDATVSFVSQAGPAGNGDYYGLRASSNSASGIAVVIKDKRTNAVIPHGVPSAPFVIAGGGPLNMDFSAAYVSTAAQGAIVPGAADADVNFTVSLP